MKATNINWFFYITFILLFTISCTDLEEEVLDGVEFENAASSYGVSSEDASSLLSSAYLRVANQFQGGSNILLLDEMTSDAMVGPTRGGDWDGNGELRKLHAHTWDPTTPGINGAFNSLYSSVNSTNIVIGATNATTQQLAEARFLRALAYYKIVDYWGQMAYREIGSDTNADALVYQRPEATDWLISELEDIVNQLSSDSDPTKANKNAAHWLLAKLYLNYGVFAGDARSPTFDNSDMVKVITNVDAIADRSIAEDYWDNFKPDNTEISPELIFVAQNFGGIRSSGMNAQWYQTQHYNQTPGGWNGYATLAEYYDLFQPDDDRILKELPQITENSGYNAGFQIGQQYGPGGPAIGPKLGDRLGNDLVFTKEVQLITKGKTLETAGIRAIKYVPDYASLGIPDNDHIIARYADALLMKAEALARNGDTGGAQAVIQMLPNENATTVSSVEDIYNVRGRELWWESWRRNDMIRFGTYLKARELKPYESDPRFLLFPVPLAATSNPNVVQNEGY